MKNLILCLVIVFSLPTSTWMSLNDSRKKATVNAMIKDFSQKENCAVADVSVYVSVEKMYFKFECVEKKINL